MPFDKTTSNSRYYTNQINSYLEQVSRSLSRSQILEPLAEYTVKLAITNLQKEGNTNFDIEGGPFGALLVDFNAKVPYVVSTGTNKVVPSNDPTAHAEVTVLRSLLNNGHNPEGLTLITSCECCPMCLSYSISLGVKEIYYAASRKEAASVGFSDEEQYIAARHGLDKFSANVNQIGFNVNLNKEEVAIIDNNKNLTIYKTNKQDNETPIVQALRSHCKKHDCFHLPKGHKIISGYKPHPYSLMAANWANIDTFGTSPNILYMEDTYERIRASENDDILIIESALMGKNLSQVTIEQVECKIHNRPFELWEEALNSQQNNAARY